MRSGPKEPGNPGTRAAGNEPSRGGRTSAAPKTASAPAQQAAAALPSISVPKGGGAIRDIDQKFSVNAANGTASLTVPLASSPGRDDFGPELSLSYDSGSGNGDFGFGWSLSIPAVTRKTDKGLPRYADERESDVFVLSGAEDLVPVLDTGASFVIPRRLNGVDYDVRCYRPRIEGLFARIERWTARLTGISHWRSISPDDVTTLYGFDADSRIADPDDARRVFTWRICRTWDPKGNVAVYEYIAEDEGGVDRGQAHEANRAAAARTTNRYLKRIKYGGATPYFPEHATDAPATPLPASWHFEIVLDYGDHSNATPLPSPDVAWPVRPDPFSSYRSGFEVRTYRRCARVLLFHHFAAESGIGADCLIRSTSFRYSDQIAPTDPRNPIYTFLASITSSGYARDGGGYLHRDRPPLELEYSEPLVQADVRTLDRESLENLPEGLDGSGYQFVDLDGEGLSGILSEENGGWGYKRNLSPLTPDRAHFGPRENVELVPSPGRLGGTQQLLDLSGDGQLDLVSFADPVAGFFERTKDERWDPFRSFASVPNVDWSEPNLKFVDLTGDGRADVLLTEDGVFTFYASLGEEGFAEAERVRVPWDERRGPAIVADDGTETIFLADMTGDGLSDLVRIRGSEVAYWPNHGYGRFGAKVTMDDAPRLGDEETFEPRRIRLADIDGSGTTDLLYIGAGGVHVSFNRCGNSWAAPRHLAVFPSADLSSSVQVVDLLGNGTACLVWSSSLPAVSRSPLRYVDLMGGRKPHLLVRARNNLGSETRVRYAPSTRFYLEGQRDGRPWITRLPFPVHVVERVETYDWIGRSRFVTTYAYHHGHFDGEEREFRGFGMVEQRDTATHREDTLFPEVVPMNEDAASFAPPILTRTWFHTGAFLERGGISRQFGHEYWVEPALRGDDPAKIAAREAQLLADTVIEDGVPAGEIREAFRALKGSTLRIEVYAEDGSTDAEHPYIVTEQNFFVRRVQPRGPNRHAVFFTHPREKIACHYERHPEDPRVLHELTLAVDDFGNVRRTVSVAYPRRAGIPEPEPTLPAKFRAMLAHDQSRLHIEAIDRAHTGEVNRPESVTPIDAYRRPLPSETTTAELLGIAPAADRFQFAEMEAHWATLWSGAHDVPYESVSAADLEGGGAPAPLGRRIVEQTRVVYRSDDLSTLLPLHTAGAIGLPGDTYRRALTPGHLTKIFGGAVTDPMLIAGGYVQPPGRTDWWMPAGTTFYSAVDGDPAPSELTEARAHFFQPRRFVDPFNAVTRVSYDAYDLLPVTATDRVGNVTTAVNDYRVLQPRRVTDPNGNHSDVAFSVLGEPVGMAIRGKAGEGDSLAGFVADLPMATVASVRADPLADPGTILGTATSRIVYDHLAFFLTRDLPDPDPPMIYTLAREKHVSDLDVAAGETTRFQHHFAYSDGMGRVAQEKRQAEPDGTGAPRWVGSGWSIFNNKGKEVRKYEPFFSATHAFEFDARIGVSSVFFYDPVDRVVGVLHSDNSYEKSRFDAWRSETWDGNDTILISDPRTDPDVGDFFQRLLGSGAFVSWHDQRIGGTLGSTTEERAANQNAAQKAAAHAATPAVAHFDSLGRTALSIADNGGGNRLPSRTAYDPEGQPLCVFDPLGRHVMEWCLRVSGGFVAGNDLAGNPLYRNGMDGGERRLLNDVAGNPLRTFDTRGSVFRYEYDAARRATHRFVTPKGGTEILAERLVYGEIHADATRNLKGRLFRHYDGAGVASHDRYDFKGNVIASRRQLAVAYRATPDWMAITSTALSVAAIDAAAAPLLIAADTFQAATRFNALNQPTQIVTPHAAGGRPSVLQPRYNAATLVEAMDAWIRRPSVPAALLDPTTADVHAITDIDYDAHGKRTFVARGNGAETTLTYDPLTFRLAHMLTVRPHADADARTVQDLAYTYDPAGNITRIRDSADIHNVVFFRDQRVDPTGDYTYDATYRLTRAKGREHLGRIGNVLNPPRQVTNDESPRSRLVHPGDGQGMGVYQEDYGYDDAGNLLEMVHSVVTGTWTRRYGYSEPSVVAAGELSNRLSSTSLPGDPAAGPFSATYDHDEHGNVTRMLHLPVMTWDVHDRLQSTARQVVGSGTPETTYYAYDGAGQRVRKITDWAAAPAAPRIRKTERIYFGPFEIYREFNAAGVKTKDRETLHVLLDEERVAMVETRTDVAGQQLIRHQFSNHLGSAALELDHAADILSYEEYFPYGATSYQGNRNLAETPKRYRFTAKERDEENDLDYFGARYYAPWLGRWTSCDPVFRENLYVYSRNNPIVFYDPEGKQESSGWNRFMGGVRALGGGVQMVVGALVFVQVEVPVAAQVVGGVAIAHGVSDWEAGWRQVRTGKNEQSAIEMGVSAGAQGLGMEKKKADAMAAGVDAGLGFVNPAGPATGLPKMATAVTTTGQRVSVLTTEASKVPQLLATGSNVMHAASAGGKGANTQKDLEGSGGGKSGETGKGASTTPETPATKSTKPATGPTKPAATNAGEYTVGVHGKFPSPRPGQQSHHGAMSAWMKQHFPGYDPNKAPAILMPEAMHRATFGVYQKWRAQLAKQMGGKFDWSKVSEGQMRELSEQMFDAAKVPKEIRDQYWNQFAKMKQALQK